jgi:hypothetical protein
MVYIHIYRILKKVTVKTYIILFELCLQKRPLLYVAIE